MYILSTTYNKLVKYFYYCFFYNLFVFITVQWKVRNFSSNFIIIIIFHQNRTKLLLFLTIVDKKTSLIKRVVLILLNIFYHILLEMHGIIFFWIILEM